MEHSTVIFLATIFPDGGCDMCLRCISALFRVSDPNGYGEDTQTGDTYNGRLGSDLSTSMEFILPSGGCEIHGRDSGARNQPRIAPKVWRPGQRRPWTRRQIKMIMTQR
ncbi:hypothetical protein H2248_005654 [Termitomyces sp. 'cryptogamus']|nr:hypothetical protein H2248_005654 [Termitomyces sp. 'cryptogamus']